MPTAAQPVKRFLDGIRCSSKEMTRWVGCVILGLHLNQGVGRMLAWVSGERGASVSSRGLKFGERG